MKRWKGGEEGKMEEESGASLTLRMLLGLHLHLQPQHHLRPSCPSCSSLNPPPPSLQSHRWIQHYSTFHTILLVGDGDFSFSNSLAIAFGSARNLVATSLDSREKVLSQYPSSLLTLANLAKLGALVIHGVDATCMATHELLRNSSFDRIIFNFPHAGFFGNEEDKCVIKKHKTLLRLFFQNAAKLIKPESGQIHVTHKVKPPYSDWKLNKQAAKSGLIQTGESCHFKVSAYPGYVNRLGAGEFCAQKFYSGGSRTFRFVLDNTKP